MSNLQDINQRLTQTRTHESDFTPEERADTAVFVQDHWPDSTAEEASMLIEIMELVPSSSWFDVMIRAERHNIEHWELLLEHGNRLYERAADAAADEDGLTYVK